MTLSVMLLAAALIFLIGNITRVVRILRAPAHIRWDLYPIPKGPREKQRYGGSYFEETEWWTKPQSHGRIGEFLFVVKEVLFLRGVRENFRALWPWSLALHWGLYLYIFIVAAGIKTRLLQIAHFNVTVSLGFKAACLVGCLGALGLIVTRCTFPRLRPFTTRSTLFNLVFLLAIFLTGAASAFVHPNSLPSPVVAASSPGSPQFTALETAHVVLLALFLAYFPFTHMTHMFMKYFTWHRVRWDDTPAVHDARIDSQLSANLGRPVSWYAGHISGTEPRTWSDVVTRENSDEVRHA